MDLHIVTDYHLSELMDWFEDVDQRHIWSGRNFSFPYDLTSFKADLNINQLRSYSLLCGQGQLLGFGQYYLLYGRCHLARLVINPSLRGQRLISILIEKLTQLDKSELGTQQCSLFVLQHNTSAINAYTRLGFKVEDYSGVIPLANCLYMIN